MQMIEAALAYTKQNGNRPPLAIFPLLPKAKDPCVPGGFYNATTEESRVRYWWTQWPNANIGFRTQGIIVLDIDKHDPAKDGAESLHDLELEHGELPETWVCLTPTGGEHFYFRCDDPRLTKAENLAPGIDYRGCGGYVLLPPSVHPNGGIYEWDCGRSPADTPLAPLPEWLHQMMLEKATTKNDGQADIPDSIKNGERNSELFKAACSLRAKGLMEEEIEAAIQTMNENRCVPPLDKKEVVSICKSAAKYERGGDKQKRKAADIPANAFDAFGFYSVPDLTEEERKPPEFIVDGMLPCGMTFLSGAPKIRKSFLALQLAIAVASGQVFLGHKTKQCDVAYLDLEGSKSRISYRTSQMSVQIPRNIFVTNAVKERLSDGLVDMIRALHQQRPQIRLVIIDTYSRARGSYKAGGANAYDADVAFLEPIQRMALEENIAILFVHHDKKGAGFMSDSFERLSGTMGISGSADCVMNLVADGKRFDGKATLEFTPRDAKGGEVKLAFDDRFGEWQEIIESKSDLVGNPVCNAIIKMCPEPRTEAIFHPYSFVYTQAFHAYSDSPGDVVRDQLKAHKQELLDEHGIGVQLGVKSNGNRGVRIINLR